MPLFFKGHKAVRYLFWLFGFVLFFLVLGFAVKNSDMVTVSYYLGYQWHTPLVLVMLAFLILGAVVGITASLGFVYKQKREILSLKRALRLKGQPSDDNDFSVDETL